MSYATGNYVLTIQQAYGRAAGCRDKSRSILLTRIMRHMGDAFRLLLPIAASVSLAGCVHPDQVVNENGPVLFNTTDQFARFAVLWKDAQDKAGTSASATNTAVTPNAATGIVTPDQIAANKALLDAGMTLIYTSCNDFFTREGARQQGFSVAQGLTGVIAPTVTGALGLVPSAGISILLVGRGEYYVGYQHRRFEFSLRLG